MDACAGDLLRYRKMIGADHVAVFTDLKKKHWLSYFLFSLLFLGVWNANSDENNVELPCPFATIKAVYKDSNLFKKKHISARTQ